MSLNVISSEVPVAASRSIAWKNPAVTIASEAFSAIKLMMNEFTIAPIAKTSMSGDISSIARFYVTIACSGQIINYNLHINTPILELY